MRSTASSAGRLAGARARAAPGRARARPPSAARLSVLARARDRVRALGERPRRAHDRDERRGRGLSVRKRRASVSHAWGRETIDDVLLRCPPERRFARTTAAFRSAPSPVDGTELDFRSARPIGGTKLDHGFTDLERDDDGPRPRHADEPATTRIRVTLWVDESYPYLMVFTGDHPDVNRRGLAVEPMTCPPNALPQRRGSRDARAGRRRTRRRGDCLRR